MSKAIAKTSYQSLLSRIKFEMTRGIKDMQKLIEKQRVLTYWNIGHYINDYLRTTPLPKGEITAFYERLAVDLDYNIRTLQQFGQLHSMFQKKDLRDGLNWSHYRYLFTVRDRSEREKWIALALKNEWKGDDLKMNLLLARSPELKKSPSSKLPEPKRGILYAYHLVAAPAGPEQDVPWMVDCGFANRIEAPMTNVILNNKWLYTSVKTDNGYVLKTASYVTVDQLYTYKAQILRIIDGDTLLVMIDQGFGVWTQQRLRLKGIDAPEMTTDAGRKAKAWVSKRMEKLSFLIVMSKKSDKYDRYLADIFYMPDETDPNKIAQEGTYLNQQLLDEGLAEIWEG